MFSSGTTAGSEECQNITIVNDGVREEVSEEFTIMLTTQDPDVILQPHTAQVLVIDNDGEQIILIEPEMFKNVFMCYFLVITIEFGQNSYEMVESESISVCVVLTGETDQSVEVTLTSQENTATGLMHLLLSYCSCSTLALLHTDILQRGVIMRLCL